MLRECFHLGQHQEVLASAEGSEDCLKNGDGWVHLLLCLSCGHVECCDSSKNRHAHRHWVGTDHPLIGSVEPGESWRWCYVDETYT